jgi:hypothetical protein
LTLGESHSFRGDAMNKEKKPCFRGRPVAGLPERDKRLGLGRTRCKKHTRTSGQVKEEAPRIGRYLFAGLPETDESLGWETRAQKAYTP